MSRARAFQFQQRRLALAAQYFDAGRLSRKAFQVLRLLQFWPRQNIATGKIAPRIYILNRRQICLLTRLQGDGFGLGDVHGVAVHLFGHNFVFVGEPIDDLRVAGRSSMGAECADTQQHKQYRADGWQMGHEWPFLCFLKCEPCDSRLIQAAATVLKFGANRIPKHHNRKHSFAPAISCALVLRQNTNQPRFALVVLPSPHVKTRY